MLDKLAQMHKVVDAYAIPSFVTLYRMFYCIFLCFLVINQYQYEGIKGRKKYMSY